MKMVMPWCMQMARFKESAVGLDTVTAGQAEYVKGLGGGHNLSIPQWDCLRP